MKNRLIVVVLLLSMSFVYQLSAYAAHDPGKSALSATPPMGYSTWNAVRFDVSDELIRQVADSMVRNGLLELGYEYVNIDDGWQGGRDSKGNLYPVASRFPFGMKALADYVHSKGLKIGIYTDLGEIGCGGRVGSYGYYQKDVDQFAEWGFDYVKVDACGANAMGLDFKTYYKQFGDALANANPKRDILYNICEWGQQQPWKWAPDIGHTWRVGYDIDNQGEYWQGVLYEIDRTLPHADVAGPGHFNDPDSLEVGVIADRYPGQQSLTYIESQSNFSMWSILASPLMLGLDVTTLDVPGSYSSQFADIIKNAEVIAINQDVAGIQGKIVDESTAGLQVFSKPLGSRDSNERAVVLFNRTDAPARMTVTANMIGLKHMDAVRDLWKKKDMGAYVNGYSDIVPPHGSVMLKVSGVNDPHYQNPVAMVAYEAESEWNTLSGAANTRAVTEASGGKVAGNIGNGPGNALQFNRVVAPVRGFYTLSIGYVSGDANRTAELYVNGNLIKEMQFPSSGGWHSTRSKTVVVELREGENTIKWINSRSGAYAPDLDRLEVSMKPVTPAKAFLEGISEVKPDQAFSIHYGLEGVLNDIYALDMQLIYDKDLFQFEGAESLLDGVQVLKVLTEENGKVRVILAAEGSFHAIRNPPQLLALSFVSRNTAAPSEGGISIAASGYSNGEGNEYRAHNASLSVIVMPQVQIDYNDDGQTSVGDLSLAALYYGKDDNSPEWNDILKFDLNNDRVIDILDLIKIAQSM